MAKQKKKIVAVGPHHDIMALRTVGVTLHSLEDSSELIGALKELAADTEVGLILVSETVAEDMQEEIADIRLQYNAVILVTPASAGSRDSTLARMKRAMELSIGVDLISKG